MANILVLGVKVPFTTGGQDILVNTLVKQLRERGHEVDTVELPFNVTPKESLLNQAAQWRSLDLRHIGGREVDLVIATKFPSYYVKHPRKCLWLVHQWRPIYDLHGGRYSDFSDDPRDEALRRMLVDGDNKVIRECDYISGISKNVVERLKHYNNIDGEALYPPLPMGERYRSSEESEDFILSVGRLCAIKRVDLMIKSLPIVHNFIKLKIVGTPDELDVMDYYKNEIDKHHLWDRVEFLGRVDDETLLDLFSKALAVYYAPHDEDYGYVTLEAMASGRPVIAGEDSGGVLEFVKHEVNGLVVEPTTDAIGHAVNRLVENKEEAKALGQAGLKFIQDSGLKTSGWDNVVDKLLSPLGLKSEKKYAQA